MNRIRVPIGTFLFAFMFMCLASCEKEVPGDEYPNELTVQNYEEFLDAPQEVIDELAENERLALEENNPHSVIPPDDPDTYQCINGKVLMGNVYGYDGTWRDMANVQVKVSRYYTYTFANPDSTNYGFRVLGGSDDDDKKLSVNTDVLNGVSALDLLLIRRHINGTQPFTSFLQVSAADVDGNEVVDIDDADLVEDALLGTITTFPIGNVTFYSEWYYTSWEDNWISTGAFINHSFHSGAGGKNFYAVKRGDVNGTFNF